MSGASIFIAIILASAFALGACILWLRDLRLKKKGKTDTQIKAASKASVATYRGAESAIIGLILIVSGIVAAERSRGLSERAVIFVPLGSIFLWLAIRQWKRSRDLKHFVDTGEMQPPEHT
jgi:hypothetical protein